MQIAMAAERKRKIRKFFTTGEIADLCGSNPKTVAVWIDSGEMKGVKYPNQTERRVHRDELRRFFESYENIWALRELDIEEGIPRETPNTEPEPPTLKRTKKKA